MSKKDIVNNIRSLYVLDPLASTNSFNHVAVDESLFSHKLGRQQWVVRLINYESKEILLELVEQRNEQTLKTIIQNHIKKENIIVTDACSGYLLLNNPAYGFFHNTYNHEGGNFGEGLDITSRTQSFCSELKNKLKKNL